MAPSPSQPAVLCGDDELGYERSRTTFQDRAGLVLDEHYRLAHLPLVAPEHPRMIPTREGSAYLHGAREEMFSLVLPIPGEALARSEAYSELEHELQGSAFSNKIAWGLLDRRRDKLHATICGSLGSGEVPLIDTTARNELAALGSVAVELRGLFSGNVNVGRLYLRAYPERRDGVNVFRAIQRILRRRETDLYVVGVFNLTDDLNATEASALRDLLGRWWDRPILRWKADRLCLLGSKDDLALESRVAETIPLA